MDFIVAKDKDSNWIAVTNKKEVLTSTFCGFGPNYDPDNCSSVSFGINVVDTGAKAIGLEGATQIMDIDGDSLQDIVYTSGVKISYYKNLGDRTFAGSETLTIVPTPKLPIGDQRPIRKSVLFNGDSIYKNSAGAQSATVMDFNGDGITDLLVGRKTTTTICNSGENPRIVDDNTFSDSTSFTSSGIKNCDTSVNVAWYLYSGTNWSTPVQEIGYNAFVEPKAVDLNGDGLTDVLWRSGNKLLYRLSNGLQFLPSQIVSISSGSGSVELTFTEDQEDYSYFLDVSNDGMTDLLISNSGKTHRTTYFARPTLASNDKVVFQARGTWAFNKNKMTQFADISGDGKIDLLEGDSSSWLVYLNKNANKLMHVISSVENGHGVTNMALINT